MRFGFTLCLLATLLVCSCSILFGKGEEDGALDAAPGADARACSQPTVVSPCAAGTQLICDHLTRNLKPIDTSVAVVAQGGSGVVCDNAVPCVLDVALNHLKTSQTIDKVFIREPGSYKMDPLDMGATNFTQVWIFGVPGVELVAQGGLSDPLLNLDTGSPIVSISGVSISDSRGANAVVQCGDGSLLLTEVSFVGTKSTNVVFAQADCDSLEIRRSLFQDNDGTAVNADENVLITNSYFYDNGRMASSGVEKEWRLNSATQGATLNFNTMVSGQAGPMVKCTTSASESFGNIVYRAGGRAADAVGCDWEQSVVVGDSSGLQGEPMFCAGGLEGPIAQLDIALGGKVDEDFDFFNTPRTSSTNPGAEHTQ